MSTSGISGVGGNIPQRGTQGEVSQKSGEMSLGGLKAAVTVNSDSASLIAQSGLQVPPPPQAPPKDLDVRVQSQSEGTQDTEGSNEKEEDVKEKKEKKQAQRKAVVRISDVDKKRGRQQQEGFMATLERNAKMRKIRDMQELIDLAWKGDGGKDFAGFSDITEVYDGIRAAQIHFSESDNENLKAASGSCMGAANVLLEEKGSDIRAGWLIGTGSEVKNDLQNYRQNVLRFKSVPQVFTAISQKVNGDLKSFQRDIEKLLKTIQQDLASGESTMEPSHLREINEELFKVQIAGQCLKDVCMLYRDLNHTHELQLPQASEQQYDIVSHDPQNLDADYYKAE